MIENILGLILLSKASVHLLMDIPSIDGIARHAIQTLPFSNKN